MLLCRMGVLSVPADRPSAGYLAHLSLVVNGFGAEGWKTEQK